MSKKNRSRSKRPIGRDRVISVRSARRSSPDLQRIAEAVVALAMAQAEADAQAQGTNSASPLLDTPRAAISPTEDNADGR